ncbi:hypothetical protein EsDP_00001335 [Epichloe bromicola]|uniref:Uncharacterized protein n=1 Tax=Epichloe bromicola TaxID=79588 RepID=A0ABQ0CHJ4_9HYPO
MERTFSEKKAYELPQQWSRLVKKMEDWVQSPTDKPIKIATLQGPRVSGKSMKLPRFLHQALLPDTGSGSGHAVIHITSETERVFLEEAYDAALKQENHWGRDVPEFPLQRMSYTDCIALVERNLDSAAQQLSSTDTRGSSGRAYFHFNHRTVFVVDVDADMSPECAHMLTGLLVWCAEASKCAAPYGPFEISVIVMTSGIIHPTLSGFLDDVVEKTASFEGVESFMVPRPADMKNHAEAILAPKDIASRLRRDFDASTTAGRLHLVICFPHCIVDGEIRGLASSDVLIAEGAGDCTDFNREEWFRKFPDYEPRHRLVVVPCGFKAPIHVEGFDAVTVVTSAVACRCIVDWGSGHVIQTYVELSQSEIWDQASLRFRAAEIPQDRIALYKVQESPPRFEQRPAVAAGSVKLPGLMAALATLQVGEPIVDLALRLLSSDAVPGLLLDRSTELGQMGILHKDMIHGDDMRILRCALSGKTRQGFYCLLPSFDHDVNLAYFAALPCQHRSAWAVKIQLACLLHVGFDRVFGDIDAQKVIDNVSFGEFYERCHGYTTSLCKEGTLWSLLAIWKHAFARDPTIFTGQTKNAISILGGHGQVMIDQSVRVLDMIAKTYFALDVPYAANLIADEPSSMTSAAIEELQWHMMKCFASRSVAAAVPVDAPLMDAANVQFVDYKSARKIAAWRGIFAFVQFGYLESIEPGKVLFGVTVRRFQTCEGVNMANDWTYIPKAIVARWLRETSDGRPDLHEAMGSKCARGRYLRLYRPT